MREKMFAVGDDYWIGNDAGERACKVDGKAIRFRDTLILETANGDEIFTIQEKKLSVRDKMEIERDGKTVATVRNALVSPSATGRDAHLRSTGSLPRQPLEGPAVLGTFFAAGRAAAGRGGTASYAVRSPTFF